MGFGDTRGEELTFEHAVEQGWLDFCGEFDERVLVAEFDGDGGSGVIIVGRGCRCRRGAAARGGLPVVDPYWFVGGGSRRRRRRSLLSTVLPKHDMTSDQLPGLRIGFFDVG